MKGMIKKWFNLYDEQDFDNAVGGIFNADNREDFLWKLKNKLFRK